MNKKVLIKSGWLGRNKLTWFNGPDNIGGHVIQLNDRLKSIGYDVKFSGDDLAGFSPDLEIHLERQIPTLLHSKKILVLSEPEFVQPQNFISCLSKYDIELDWRTDRSYNSKRLQFRYPRDLNLDQLINTPNFSERKILVNCIAANKNAVVRSRYSLYKVRQKYIEQLSLNLDENFHLYGGGWDLINHPIGLVAKFAFRVPAAKKWFRRKTPITSYRGRADNKTEIMTDSKFTLCIDNSSASGCVSEKLIDCFQHGTIPLYLGANDIHELIAKDLYVDLRQFGEISELIGFLSKYDESHYQIWKSALLNNAEKIGNEHGIAQYVNKIVRSATELLGAT